MKSIIKYAIELDLLSMEIKEGYNGAPLLNIETKNENHANLLFSFISNITKDIKIIKYNKINDIGNKTDIEIYKISGVFGEDTIKNEYYELK